jgi:tetratricopeptide (TPR) repeat protein
MSDQTKEHIELLREELEDIDRQVLEGDLDAATAAVIRERYQSELADLEAASLSATMVQRDTPSASGDPSSERRLTGRALVGVALVAVACAAIALFAVNSLTDSGLSGAEGVASDVVSGEDQIDLDNISNEQMEEVVESNPEIVPMRLALARRYFEAGEFDKALDHYFEVLDREQHPEALANVGWMTYLSGRPDVAVGYLEAALDRQPGYLTAQWFLGNVYVSLERFPDALIPLTAVVASDSAPEEVKDKAIELLEQIGSGG